MSKRPARGVGTKDCGLKAEQRCVRRPTLAASMQQGLGSTRALACSDRRLAGRNGGAIQSLNGGPVERAHVVGEGADHSTRRRVRSPSQQNGYGLAVFVDLRPIFTKVLPLKTRTG